ncbi:MAG: hypothetical protein JWN13_1800 [Betaproteobacteria bacterium]|nr:hypothetical protein [Betaproteobacteria bacterium]
MKRNPLMAAATLTLLMTSALVPSQNYAQDTIHSMPEVVVTGEVEARPHPQDGNYSERPLGCVEIVTPRGTGNELGGYHQARNARAGIPVMPNLNDPRSAGQWPVLNEYQAIPPGSISGNPRCR